MVNNVPHDRTSHSVVAILYLSHCLIIPVHVLLYSSWSKSASPITYVHVYMCVFVSCKMLFIYQSFKEIYIIFFLFVPHQFLAVCCSASGIHFPCTPTNPNNFHTIDLNLLLTLSTILFEIFKMFLPTLMISKINE